MDHITPLLYRLTRTSYADLDAALGRLPIDQYTRLDALAREILDDARAIAHSDGHAPAA